MSDEHIRKNKITAKHSGQGVWDFTCEAHEEAPHAMRGISSPKHAMQAMKDHVDKDHPGEKFQLYRASDWSGHATATYTGKVPK